MAKPAACGLPQSISFCAASSCLAAPAKIAFAASPLMLAATMPDPASAVSNVIGIVVAGVGRPRPRDDDHALGATLPRGARLEAQVGIAREDLPRLLIGVLGK